jgi:hypothetical protein
MTTTLQESLTLDLAQIFRNYPTGRLLRLGLKSSLPASLLWVSNAYAEAPRGIQQVRYRKGSSSSLSPRERVRAPC